MRKRINYAIEREKKSLEYFRNRKHGKLYLIILDLILFLIIVYLIVFSFFPYRIDASVGERQLYLPDVPSEETFKIAQTKEDKELSYKKALYSIELAEELKYSAVDKVYNIAKKQYKTVEKKHIELAYDICAERLNPSVELSMGDFLELFAINVTIMEIESGFNQDLIGINPTSKDYGIMQINSTVIKTAEKELGKKLNVEHNLHDNVNVGSWEIYTCFEKAKEKHPDNVLWWSYAYYNRGLYFENTVGWKSGRVFNQANTRSKIFIEKFNKYYKCL